MEAGYLDRIDWNKLSGIELERIEGQLAGMLSANEKAELDMVFSGMVLLFRAKRLSWKVNAEILGPLAEWLRDPEVLNRHRFDDEAVKDISLSFERHGCGDRSLQAARLRLYWEEVRRKKEFFRVLADDINKLPADEVSEFDAGMLSDFVEVFSVPSEDEAVLAEEFARYAERHLAHRLPLRELMVAELIGGPLPLLETVLCAGTDKVSVVARLGVALQLECEGAVELCQCEPFGTITVVPRMLPEPVVVVKGRDGVISVVHIGGLSEEDKKGLVVKLQQHEVVCTYGEE